MTEIKKTEGEIKVLQAKLELLKEMENHKTPVEEAYKNTYGWYPPISPSVSNYCEDNRWSAFQNGYNASKEDCEVEEPTKPMNEVLDRLENKYKDAEENAASYMTDEVVNRMLKKWEENPPSFLRFELSRSLEALITRWWDDVLYGGIHQDWAIDDLIDQIQLWLPKSQSSSGSQSLGVEDMVEGFNDCLKKIKSKLRNKKI